MKLIKIAAIGFGTLVALVVLVLLFGVPAKPLLGYVQDQADKAGYRLRVEGAAKLSLWPSLNIAADDVRVGDNDNPDLLAARQIRIEVPLLSLVSGDPRISELALKEPVIKVTSGRGGRGSAQSDKPKAMSVDRLTIENGTLITRDVRENLEFRIDAMAVTAALPAQGPLDFQMQGKSGDQTVRLTMKANSASQIAEGRSTPIDVRLDLPGALKGSLAFTANLRSTNQVTSIDGIRGTLGSGRVNGSVSVDTSGARPSTTANLVFDRLEMGNADRRNAAAGLEPWSDKPLELRALRIFDAVIKISARELSVGNTVLSPADIEMNLTGGLMSITLSRAELYGGPVQGRFVVDAAAREPRHGMNFEFSKVNALPFLTDVAGFDYFEGNLQGRFDLTATGNSERAIMSSLGGTVQMTLQDGAIRGLNIPSIVRALSSQTLQGWQERQTEKTDLTSMNASYRIANGVATVEDMRLSGPFVRMTGKGTVNIQAQTVDLRVDPKVVLSSQGQGGPNDPAGLGVPIVIRGPWNNPQLHPDVSGILDNPDAAFAKLKTMGGSLFGVLRDEASTPAGRKRLEDAGKSLEQMMREGGGFKPPTAEQRSRARDAIRDFFGR